MPTLGPGALGWDGSRRPRPRLGCLDTASAQTWDRARGRGLQAAPDRRGEHAYQAAVEPKRLVTVAGGHFDAYTGTGFGVASGAARDWFVAHLINRSVV